MNQAIIKSASINSGLPLQAMLVWLYANASKICIASLQLVARKTQNKMPQNEWSQKSQSLYLANCGDIVHCVHFGVDAINILVEFIGTI